MDWAQILVIILSVFLALFLLLAIILMVVLIKLTRQIKSVTGSAQRTAESVEKAVVGFTNITSPVFLAKQFAKQVKKFKSK
ncbi:MAG: exported protein of unknown function [Candidatus Saccharibacteria bacterium]|nr:exported protein of unknown function [Candidatus Saccharibacteria bacterium]